MKPVVLLLSVVSLAAGQTLVSPESRECRLMAAMDEESMPDSVPEYVAGEVMEVHADIPDIATGIFEFYLCPEMAPGDEECLVKLPLQIAGGVGKQFDPSLLPSAGHYTIPLEIPSDISCEMCTLMWVIAETLCPEGTAGPCVDMKTEMCADVSIAVKRQEEKRFLDDDFLNKVFGSAVRGVARHVGQCDNNNENENQ